MDADLDELFDALNAGLFEGRLPKYRVRRCASRNGERGFIDGGALTIWICTAAEIRPTLLHEMCHIGTPGHGRLFRAKLRRLTRCGEAWAQVERVYYLRVALGMRAERWLLLWGVAREFRGGLLVGNFC